MRLAMRLARHHPGAGESVTQFIADFVSQLAAPHKKFLRRLRVAKTLFRYAQEEID